MLFCTIWLSIPDISENVNFDIDENSVPEEGVDGAVFNSDEVYVPEVKLEIGDVLFNEGSRDLIAVVTVENTTNTFLDDLQYTLELMKGDELNLNGYVFENAEHVYQETHDIGKMAPYEKKTYEMKMFVPYNIETANYFLQVFVNDKNIKFQNVAIVEHPFELQGSGGRLSDVKMYFYSDRYGEKTFPSEGLSTEPDDEPKIIIPLEENTVINDRITSGNYLRAKVEIYRTIKDGGLVKDFIVDFNREDVDGEDSLTVDLLANNDELRDGGSFDVNITILDENSEEVYKRNMRWLVEYGQMVGRILSVESGTNLYKEGERLDLVIETALFNAVGKKGLFNIVITGRDGFEQVISEEVEFVEEDVNSFDFSHVTLADDAHITHINTSLKDVEKDVIVDVYETNIDFDAVYGRDDIKKNAFITFLQENIYIIWVFGSIIFGLLVIIIFKFVEKRKGMHVALLILFGVSIFFAGSYVIDAACKCKGGKPSGSLWITRYPPTTVTCGASARMDVALRVTCRSCINGVRTKITTSSGDTKTKYYGHVSNATIYHAFSQKINKRTLMWAKAYFTHNGCHCCASPGTGGDGCYPGVKNGSMCAVNVHIGTVSRWVNCSNPNPVCGTSNGRTYPWNAVGWGSGTFCSNGSVNPGSPAFPGYGQTTSWSCANAGRTVSCSASRGTPPNPVCGSRDRAYAWNTTIWPSGSTWCAVGTHAGGSNFPAYGGVTKWTCGLAGKTVNCSATRANPPQCACSPAAESGPYSYLVTQPTTPLCTAGTPTPATVSFPGQYGGSVSWTCGAPNCTGATDNCSASRDNPLPCECGSADNTLSESSPSSSLCNVGDPSSVTGKDVWNWTCGTENVDADGPGGLCTDQRSCSAECIDVEIDAPEYIYTDNGDSQTVEAKIRINGDQNYAKDINCTIGGQPVNFPSGSNTSEPVDVTVGPEGTTITASCTINVDCGNNGSRNSRTFAPSHTIGALCMQRSCTQQGTCQAVPQNATSGCSSTCSSDADCSSGRMIETRP
jgi:hypothetical protein